MEELTMTTFGWIITIIGVAAFSGQLMRLIERVASAPAAAQCHLK